MTRTEKPLINTRKQTQLIELTLHDFAWASRVSNEGVFERVTNQMVAKTTSYLNFLFITVGASAAKSAACESTSFNRNFYILGYA